MLPKAAEWLKAELAEIQSIYDRLFADCTLTLILLQGEDPRWGHPHIIEGPMTLSPDHLGPRFLGRIIRPAPMRGAPEVTVLIEIPRRPNPDEIRNDAAPWQPNGRLGALFGMTPLTYEDIRYRVEMWRKKRSVRIHRHDALPRGKGMQLPVPAGFSASLPETSPQDPAILIGFHWLEVGGAEKLAFDCVRWARAAGLRVFVVASVPALQRLADKLPQDPAVRFIRLDRYLPHWLWPRFLQKLVKDENIRLIHIHHCQPIYDALPQIRAFSPQTQVIDSTHIVEYPNGGFPRTSGVWSNFLDMHHVISGQLTDYFKSRFNATTPVRLGRMIARHDATGAQALPPLTMTVRQPTLHLAFIGRLYYQKRPIVLVLILQALDKWAKRNGVDWQATVIGEGSFESAIKRLLARYRLSERVSLLPAAADVGAVLDQADILLLPSNNEGLALVCYEAIEHGTIPISTDVGSQDEIIPPDLLVPLAPRATLRDTMRIIDRLWRDGDFLARQGQALHAAWARISADPTAEEVLMPIYREAAGVSEDIQTETERTVLEGSAG